MQSNIFISFPFFCPKDPIHFTYNFVGLVCCGKCQYWRWHRHPMQMQSILHKQAILHVSQTAGKFSWLPSVLLLLILLLPTVTEKGATVTVHKNTESRKSNNLQCILFFPSPPLGKMVISCVRFFVLLTKRKIFYEKFYWMYNEKIGITSSHHTPLHHCSYMTNELVL